MNGHVQAALAAWLKLRAHAGHDPYNSAASMPRCLLWRGWRSPARFTTNGQHRDGANPYDDRRGLCL